MEQRHGPHDDDHLLAGQVRYYDRRAPVYEQLYFLEGPYAGIDPETARIWRTETAELDRFARSVGGGAVLELACGNGLWTRFLAPAATRLVAIDASPRMLERNRSRIADTTVEYVQADLFDWDTDDRFDLVFVGFFLSHVPPSRWRPFWDKVRSWLAPNGSVAFVDDVRGNGITEPLERPVEGPQHAQVRKLGDERFVIVKRLFTPTELDAALAEVGFSANTATTGAYFLHGTAWPTGG